jgi:two-component system CheB/CheR fusion protein
MAGEEGDNKNPRRKREQKKAPNEYGPTGQPPAAERPSEQPVQEQAPAEPETAQEELEAPETRGRSPCPVAGVGASAGGLEALQGLFANLPSEPSLAFVVVQHRATDRTSVMKSLIEKHTRLTVNDIVDGTKIEPGAIYLAPADKDVSIMHGVLYLVEPPPHSGIRLPIDSFLRTLARDEAERAICIILSGTGSDGTLGLKEIKAAGGMVMAQKEDQAKYDSMPRSAIETGMVDFVLPVETMGEQLMQYIRYPYLEQRRVPEPEEKIEDQLQRVFMLIRNQTGHDFSHYKRNTIRRRIARRLAVHQIEDLDHYIKLLQENTEEVSILAREMLITVTNFFRDREAWESLAEEVIRPLVEEKPSEIPLRIWVPGCATGEEAYTVAILFHEQMARDEKHHLLQIFASDLDDESIDIGRRGIYPKSIAADVSAVRLKRFFTEEGNSYKVRNNIRETIVFAKHNLIKDAPFSKLDLVCCRNVLIYMDNSLQRKLIPMFHYTLNAGGILFLGESESIGTFADLFAPVDAKRKIFRRKPVETGYEPQMGDLSYPLPREGGRERPRAGKRALDTSEIAERVILRDYSLPCVLVDEEFNIVYFNGDTSPYLAQPSGKPTTNVIQMARPEIHFKLNLLLKRAFHEKHMAMEKGIQIRVNDHFFETDIVVRPVAEGGTAENLMLVVFKSRPKERKPGEGAVPLPTDVPAEETDGRIRELEQEVQSTREYLQTTIEELETSNEELKSSNEELQSTNEELQSTNEELDTSREELQSTNEELRTVNSEHQQKIDELSKAYDDLNNLLGASEVATLFLDHDLKIRRFTPAARKIFRLIDRDIGRPLDDIATRLKCDTLLADIRNVLATLTRVEREIECEGTEWFQMRVVPYRTAENVIQGAVVTFLNITQQKVVMVAREQAAAFAEAVVETVRQPLLILDKDLKVINANPAFYRHFRTRREETIGANIYELDGNQWNIPELRTLLEKIIPENSKFEDFQVQAEFPKIGARTMLLNARQVLHEDQPTGRVLLAFEDITERAQSTGQKTEDG